MPVLSRAISHHFGWRCDMSIVENTMKVEPLLTTQQAADLLAVNERMIRRLVESRRIPFVKVGRHVRFRETDLARAMDAWTTHPSGRAGLRRA